MYSQTHFQTLPKKFEVTFSNGQGVYHPGQPVQGQIVIGLAKPMPVRGVTVGFDGKCFVMTGMTGDQGTRCDGETYFHTMPLKIGRRADKDGEWFDLEEGEHTYPFSYELPLELPSSFEGTYGHVRYFVTAALFTPEDFHQIEKIFTVIGELDLNTVPIAAVPVEEWKSKEFFCLCCGSGPLSARVHLDRHGYVPGETIIFNAEVDNKSNKEMVSSAVTMTMTVRYWTGKEKTTTKYIVTRLTHSKILPGETDYWNGERVHIPPLPPSNLRGCRVIDISYTLKLRVYPSRPGFDLVLPIEIAIGTIPLHQVIARYCSPELLLESPVIMPSLQDSTHPDGATCIHPAEFCQGESLPTDSVYSASQMDGVPDAPSLRPSYQEWKFGRENPRFAPLYTYYEWEKCPSVPSQTSQKRIEISVRVSHRDGATCIHPAEFCQGEPLPTDSVYSASQMDGVPDAPSLRPSYQEWKFGRENPRFAPLYTYYEWEKCPSVPSQTVAN